MKMINVKVFIKFKEGVLDPQGKAVKSSLASLGFNEVEEVKVGKYVELKINGNDAEAARQRVDIMCKKLLANPVIENFEIKIG